MSGYVLMIQGAHSMRPLVWSCVDRQAAFSVLNTWADMHGGEVAGCESSGCGVIEDPDMRDYPGDVGITNIGHYTIKPTWEFLPKGIDATWVLSTVRDAVEAEPLDGCNPRPYLAHIDTLHLIALFETLDKDLDADRGIYEGIEYELKERGAL